MYWMGNLQNRIDNTIFFHSRAKETRTKAKFILLDGSISRTKFANMDGTAIVDIGQLEPGGRPCVVHVLMQDMKKWNSSSWENVIFISYTSRRNHLINKQVPSYLIHFNSAVFPICANIVIIILILNIQAIYYTVHMYGMWLSVFMFYRVMNC